jgi:hypothetical protein
MKGENQPSFGVFLSIADALEISPFRFMALILEKMGRSASDEPGNDAGS